MQAPDTRNRAFLLEAAVVASEASEVPVVLARVPVPVAVTTHKKALQREKQTALLEVQQSSFVLLANYISLF